jgi:hypothetical protein
VGLIAKLLLLLVMLSDGSSCCCCKSAVACAFAAALAACFAAFKSWVSLAYACRPFWYNLTAMNVSMAVRRYVVM